MVEPERRIQGEGELEFVYVSATEHGRVQCSVWVAGGHATLYLDGRAARNLAAQLQDVSNRADELRAVWEKKLTA